MDIKFIIDLVLLIILLTSAVWLFSVVSRYGGSIGKSFKIIGWGSIVMASAHLTEVLTAHFFMHDVYALMFLHRFLATVGFVVIAYGFRTLVINR